MLNWIIAFLQRLQARKSSPHPWIHKTIALLPGLLITVGTGWVVFAESSTVPNSAFVFLGWLIVLYTLMGRCVLLNKIKPYEFLYLIYIPLILVTIVVAMIRYDAPSGDISTKNILMLGVGVYPFLHLCSLFFSLFRIRFFRLISHIALAYNIGFFLLLTFNYLCLTFGLEINGFGGFSEVFNGLISSVHNNYNSNFWEALLLYPT
ncbi:hypothetical protein KA050_03010, partial [Candidatus Gracilibacteria bacterium]|nr:hypothetical protein [Candidatus Gracilibacteria bacterium]